MANLVSDPQGLIGWVCVRLVPAAVCRPWWDRL